MIVNNTLNDTNSVFYPLSAILHPCGGEASIHYHSWIFLNIPFHLLYFLVRYLLSFVFIYIEMCSQCGINTGWLVQMIATSQSMKTAIFQLDWVPLWVRWCGVAGGCRHVWGSHALYSYSHYTLPLYNGNGGHRLGWSFIGYNANIWRDTFSLPSLMDCNWSDFLSLFNEMKLICFSFIFEPL